MTEHDEKDAALVAAMDDPHLNYHVEMDAGEAVAYVRAVEDYNDWTSALAERLIEDILRAAPPHGFRPEADIRFVVGREGSRVLYACFNTSGVEVFRDEAKKAAFRARLETLGKRAKADESDEWPHHPTYGSTRHFCWRFWWD